jgi:glucokinase
VQTDVLGIDVGGTAIKTWRSSGAGPTVPTPKDDPTGERTADVLAGLAAASDVAAIGVVTPGIVDDDAGIVRMSVNLGWREVPLRDLVAERTGRPVVLAHDVRAGAVAEWRTGAGAGRDGALVFAPLGTGLALAVVDASGRAAGSGWAGEVGQLRYPQGPLGGLRVEEVASAGGLAKRFGAPDAVAVLAARAAGDARAGALWDETVAAIAEVLAWTIAVVAPTAVVIGGGLALAGATLFDPLREALVARLGAVPLPALLPAQHGSSAGAVGAHLLALDLVAAS